MGGIVPVFDPTTGASGGPAPVAGGASLYNLGTVVDLTDGSWTLYDPLSAIQSVAFSGSKNTVTFNAVTGSNNRVWATNVATADAPRWYRALSIDGNAIDSDTLISMQVSGTWDYAVRDFRPQLVVGLCLDPTTTTRANILGQGFLANLNETGNPAFGSWANTAGTVTSTGLASISGQYLGQYGARRGGYGIATALDASDLWLNYIQRVFASTLTSTATVYEIVGLGTNSSSAILLNDQTAFILTTSMIKAK